MDKLEALDIILHPMRPENFRGNKLVEAERMVRKALTSPTSEEVCEVLEKVYNHQVSYREDIKSFGFYDENEWYYITYSYKETFGISDAQTASNLLLIARFYEGVVENE